MTFDKNETTFPSVIHQAIWNAARLIFPLGKALSTLQNEADKTACADLHHAILAGYEDIFYHPTEYGLDPMDAEFHLSGRPWSKAIILAINKEDKPALDYFKRAESRLHFFRFICNKISNHHNILDDQHVRFSKDTYKKILASSKSGHGYSKERFAQLLQRLSFVITPDGDDFVVTNTKYPHLFGALKRLSSVNIKEKASRTHLLNAACQYFDFRVLAPDYTCTLEDALYSLDDANKAQVIRLDAFLTTHGAKRTCRLNYVEWKYKTKRIVRYEGKKFHFDINKDGNENNLITIQINQSWSFHWPKERHQYGPEKNTENREAFENAVNALPNANAVKDFCLKHFKRCRECGCLHALPPRGHPKILFGKALYSCGGGTTFGVAHLTPDNFDHITDLIKISMAQA